MNASVNFSSVLGVCIATCRLARPGVFVTRSIGAFKSKVRLLTHRLIISLGLEFLAASPALACTFFSNDVKADAAASADDVFIGELLSLRFLDTSKDAAVIVFRVRESLLGELAGDVIVNWKYPACEGNLPEETGSSLIIATQRLESVDGRRRDLLIQECCMNPFLLPNTPANRIRVEAILRGSSK